MPQPRNDATAFDAGSQIETYQQAVDYLYGRINYERVASHTYSVGDFKLDRMRELLKRLGNPQESIPAVHIAGTKGKGSTAAMVASMLTAAGHRTGLFTSPHIAAFEERLIINGQQATPEEIVSLVRQLAGVVAELDKLPGHAGPTYFEMATAMAWLWFREQQVKLAVLEVGLGGRLDSTNVCCPAVTVITTISRDHMRQLGFRLEQIAAEKAGIIKPGVPVISGVLASPADAVIARVAAEFDAPLLQLGRDFSYFGTAETAADGAAAITVKSGETIVAQDLPQPLVGGHQAHNLALAVMAVQQLRTQGWNIPAAAMSAGLSRMRWPGRIEVVRREPTVVIDAAHNWAAVQALCETLRTSFSARRRILIFAATQDKDVAGMLRQLMPVFDSVILTQYQNNPRAVPTQELARLAVVSTNLPFHMAADPAASWRMARSFAGPQDLICITGSFFIAAELRELILVPSEGVTA